MKNKFMVVLGVCMAVCLGACGNAAEGATGGNAASIQSEQKGESEDSVESEASTVPLTLEELLAHEVTPDSDFKFSTDKNGEVSICEYSGTDDIVVLPETFNDKPVSYACRINSVLIYDSNVRGIRISDSVIEIRVCACSNNKYLEIVYIGKNVKTIEGGTFDSCDVLHTVILNEGLESIGNYAFVDCPNLLEIEIPSTVTEIGEDAFPKNEDFVIIGESGSYAETYAVENGITFRAK